MSVYLVRRWRRIARQWRQAAINQAIRGQRVGDGSDGIPSRARAEVYEACADSLECSLERRARSRTPAKSRKGAA